MEYDKQFLVIGSMNAITYKETFPLIKDNRLWLGYGFKNGDAYFHVPPHYREHYETSSSYKDGMMSFRNLTWYTNMDHEKRHEHIILYKKYDKEEYPKYNNYDIINIDKVKEIPKDYDGLMGVPITFLQKWNPDQFEILGIANSARWIEHECLTVINDRKVYNRIIIRNKEL